MKKLITLTTVLLLTLMGTASANYTLKHSRREHCRHGYVRKVEHKHGHRLVVCVRKAKPKAKITIPITPLAIPAPTPQSTTPVHLHLHAHLDPSFIQDPTNPAKVTYQFSAGATATQDSASVQTETPAPLPQGVLSLYSNGVLACSINVGGNTTSGECPVQYKALGPQTVTTIFTSGEASATETTEENIEPYVVTTTLSSPVPSCGTTVTQTMRSPKENEIIYKTDTFTICEYNLGVKSEVQSIGYIVPSEISVCVSWCHPSLESMKVTREIVEETSNRGWSTNSVFCNGEDLTQNAPSYRIKCEKLKTVEIRAEGQIYGPGFINPIVRFEVSFVVE